MRLALALAILLASVTAHADDAAIAKQHFENANYLVKMKRHREAIGELELAYQKLPRSSLLFNIAREYQTLAEAGASTDMRKSVEYFRKYLLARKDAPDRAQVQAWISELEARSSTAEREEAARAAVVQNEPAPIAMNPLVHLPAPVPAGAKAAVHGSRRRAGIGVLVAGGVLAIAGAAVFGYGTTSGNAVNSAGNVGDREAQLSTARTLNLTGAVLMGVGAGAAVAGIVLVALPAGERATSYWLAPSSSGLLAGGTF